MQVRHYHELREISLIALYKLDVIKELVFELNAAAERGEVNLKNITYSEKDKDVIDRFLNLVGMSMVCGEFGKFDVYWG